MTSQLAMPPAPMARDKLTVAADGGTVFTRNGIPVFVTRCWIATSEDKDTHAGDLIFVGNQQNSPSEVHLLYRRWSGTGAVFAAEREPAPWLGELRKAEKAARLADAPKADDKTASAVPPVPSMPEEPGPIFMAVNDNHIPGGNASVWLTFVNRGPAPLSGYAFAVQDAATGGRWSHSLVDACRGRHIAWQRGQSWTMPLGMRIAVQQVNIHFEAAVFSDGNTWGDPQSLAKLKSLRGDCQWPGS